jgi:hypothetical protein
MNWRTNVVLTVGFLGVRTPLGQDALWVGRILHSNTALDPSLGSLPGAATGTTFVLVCRRSPRRLVSASTPKRQQSKIIAWCLRYHPHYITHCSKMGNSCNLRLVRDWPHRGSAAKTGRSTSRNPLMGTREEPSVLQARLAAARWRPIAKRSGAALAASSCSAPRRERPAPVGLGTACDAVAHFATGGARRRPRLIPSLVISRCGICRDHSWRRAA